MISEAGENGLQVIDTDSDDDMDLTEAAEGASIIRFVNQILTEAIELRATDVHIEPFEESLRVRYRIDGVLQEASIAAEVKQFQAAIVSRLKILAKLDIAEKRVPQDGRIKIIISGREIDVRVSVIPMIYGEAVVLRLLDRSSVLLGMDKLGMSPRDLQDHGDGSGTAARDHSRDGPDRQRQDHHALRGLVAHQRHRSARSSRSKTPSSTSSTGSTRSRSPARPG